MTNVIDWAEDVERLRKRLCEAIYKDLEKEYNYQTSDECLVEMAEANGFHFTISGRSM